MEKEIRKIDNNLKVESRLVEGYALLFNTLSKDLGGFVEKIESDALDGVIESSDIFALLNHDNKRGILARSNFGKGSLTLTIDDRGLKYTFLSPKTALGDELIEMLDRGDITESSFSFSVKNDKWEKKSDGTYIRTIVKFDKLFDVSPVYDPAYSDTIVSLKRYLENENKNNIIEPEVNETELVEPEVNEPEVIETEVIETELVEPEVIETELVEPEVNEPEVNETESKIESIKSNNNLTDNKSDIEYNSKKNNLTKMENFKLINVINKMVERRELTDLEQSVLNLGKASFRKSGISESGNIQLPFEYRSDITATGSGAGIENVGETKLSIVEPLYDELALVKAGAQVLTGLVGDVSIPTYAGSSVLWKGETAAAADGAGAFGEVVLKPKRLTAFIGVSKQFLLQDSNDAELMLRRDIMNAIGEKLEETILGNTTGTTQPSGLFFGVTGTTGATYTAITNLESLLENKAVKNYSFIVNPKAKFALKNAKINEGRMVFQDNSIDGITAYSTSSVYSKGVIAADWRDLVIGFWGIDITMDPYTSAKDGKVNLIVNAYVDAAFKRNSYEALNLA